MFSFELTNILSMDLRETGFTTVVGIVAVTDMVWELELECWLLVEFEFEFGFGSELDV